MASYILFQAIQVVSLQEVPVLDDGSVSWWRIVECPSGQVNTPCESVELICQHYIIVIPSSNIEA